MELRSLNERELRDINGGTQESYDIGKNVGKHIRALIMTAGEFFDALSPFA